MPLEKRQKVFLGFGFLLLGAILLWLSCPLWFPWVLRPIARAQGVAYGEYRREGYSRFSVTRVELKKQGARLDARRVEALVPTVWLWRSAVEGKPRQPFFTVDDWQYQSSSASRGNESTDEEVRGLQDGLTTLTRWLPSAALTNGTVFIQTSSVALPFVTLRQGQLQANVAVPSVVSDLSIHAELNRRAILSLRLSSEKLRFQSQVEVVTHSSGTELLATNTWQGNRIEANAHFGRAGLLPETASVTARDIRLPPGILAVPGYQNVSGSATVSWSHGLFSAQLHATASPASPSQLPAVELEMAARGNTNSVTIETLRLTSSWIRADISRPMVVAFTGPLLQQPVELNLTVDLDRQRFYPLQGTLKGTARLEPALGKIPEVRLYLGGSDVGERDLKAKTLQVEAQFRQPWLLVEEAKADFPDGSSAGFRGQLDLDRKVLAGGHFQVAGPLARRWLPPGYSYQELSISGEAEGSLSELAHRGALDVKGFASPALQPVQVRMNWRGKNLSLEQFELSLSATNSLIEAQGGLTTAGSGARLELKRLTLSTNQQPALELSQPSSLSFTRKPARSEWQLETTPIEWRGHESQLHIQASADWPDRGAFELQLKGFSPSLFAGFLKTKLPDVEVSQLEASAAWSNQPVAFWVRGELRAPEARIGLLKPDEGQVHSNRTSREKAVKPPQSLTTASLGLSAHLNVVGDQNGISISNLVVSSGSSNVVVARGFLPIVVEPASGTNLVRFDFLAPLHLVATAQPDAFFWNELGTWAGIEFSDPQLKLELSGTWAAPAGAVELDAGQIKLKKAPPTLPAVENLHFVLHLQEEQAVLNEGQFFIQGQPVNLTGQVPLGSEFWRNLSQKKPPDLQKATARIRIRKAELAAFEPLFPSILAPEGQLDLDLAVLPGEKLSGQMLLQNARTRPLGDLGPLRHIDLRMQFQGRTVKLERARAEMSAAEVQLAGQGDLSGTQWLQGQLPPFTVTLYGTNVPLAREPEVVVRSDVQLAVTKTNGAPPLITGLVRLRDSFFLADLSALIPGKVATVSRRPPYFSVEDPFVADWRLAIGVQGERFLKVRTPVFNGEISANLKLQGTLKDPIALGDLKIDSGSVTFPFSTLQVQQGLVNLTSENPYHPQLSVSAASKQFGYDIRLDVSGPVDAPVIRFNSTPPLSSEQILLMVTAGQLPQGTFTLTPQQRAQTVAMFFGRDLLSKLGIGDQGQERLLVQSGQEISDQGRPTYHVEYKLSNRWSLVGEYDRFGDFNAGFKWRLLSR